MIAGLEILNLHAQGGMAEVYRARGKGADGRTWLYAVKRILPELTANNELRSMFVEEARVASLLVHPNIVRVYDLAKSENDDLYIVMEFLEGRDLAEAIDRTIDLGRPVPVWLAIHLAREVLQALVYATTTATDREGRSLALIHRDISPHNIFVCFDGQVKLTDFGVAKVAQSNVLTQVGVTKGKFGYMSPEQLMSERLDFRSDLYNVGILLYESLTGRKLFNGDNASQFLQAMLRAEVPALDPALRVPPELDALMRSTLAKNRNDRPANAAELEGRLAGIAQRYNLLATREHVAAELRAIFGSEVDSCAVGNRPQTTPKRLASISAALPEVVQRAEVPRVPTRVPTRPPMRITPRPSTQAPSSSSAAGTPSRPPTSGSAGASTSPMPPAPKRIPTRPAPPVPTRSKKVVAPPPEPETIPPDSAETIPPPSSADQATAKRPIEKPDRAKRPTIVAGGGAKAIGLRVDDDPWGEATGEEIASGGVVTRSKRVVALPNQQKK